MKFFSLFLTLLFCGNLLALKPSKMYKNVPSEFGLTYKEEKFLTAENKELTGWYIESNLPTKSLLLICHNGNGNMSDHLVRASKFLELGYNVFMFDYQGYGSSTAFEIDNNMYIYPHFIKDVEGAIDHCRKTHSEKFDMYGFGIGAGLSLGIGYTRAEVKRIIADTPFLSMEDLEERFESWEKPMDVPFAGYDKKYEPISTLDLAKGANLTKIKLIVSDSDVLYKAADMQKLISKNKEIFSDLHTVVGAKADNFDFDNDAYITAIKNFLAE